MKGSRSHNNMQNKQFTGQRPRSDVRDDLDHREGEEQLQKGDDETHNDKQTKEKHLKKKNKS